MKYRIVFLLLFVVSFGFSQSVNDYKAVIIPIRYDFQNEDNQYRLQTITKHNLQKAGFQAFYSNEQVPVELNDRCALLYLDVKRDNAFLVTKLFITFKDCNNKLVFQSEIGRSREKGFEESYTQALNEAFMSVAALEYSYNGGLNKTSLSSTYSPTVSAPVVSSPTVVVVNSANSAVVPVVMDNVGTSETEDVLYAQPTPYGYQLVNSEPKVIMKIYKTSNPISFMANKGNVQGVLVSKDNQWFFEYYKDDKLVSEKVSVKF